MPQKGTEEYPQKRISLHLYKLFVFVLFLAVHQRFKQSPANVLFLPQKLMYSHNWPSEVLWFTISTIPPSPPMASKHIPECHPVFRKCLLVTNQALHPGMVRNSPFSSLFSLSPTPTIRTEASGKAFSNAPLSVSSHPNRYSSLPCLKLHSARTATQPNRMYADGYTGRSIDIGILPTAVRCFHGY